jgi:hypothetical protein
MTELAETIIEDGQALRAIHNYLSKTFDGVKQQELYDITFTDRIEFIQFIQDVVCPVMISSISEWKLDEEEEYLKKNQL